MSSKLPNLPKSKTVKKVNSQKKPSITNSIYAGLPNAQRVIQLQRYFGSASPERFAQLKRGYEHTIAATPNNCDLPSNYHPWESEYHKIITREKNIKSMTKDPYTPMTRLISHAVESTVIEDECCSMLIPATAVKIKIFNIQRQSRPSLPTAVRYIRRDQPMPSERLPRPSTSVKMPLLSQSEYKKATISVLDISKITSVAPTLATTDRLFNRVKARNDRPIIRRPPRKLILNLSRDKMMRLSIYN